MMRKRFFLYILIILFLFACAKKRPYVKVIKPPPSNTIALPEETRKEIPGFYEVNGERYYPLSYSTGFIQTGKASWYGKKFQGRSTASGEIYDMHKKSAAHKTLPLGTYVKVVNLSNNKQIIVPINDRGPFVKGRIIDLSYSAAKELDMIGPGVADVKITALSKKVGVLESENGPKPLVELKDLKKGVFTVQVGAFRDRNNALRLANRLKVIFDYVNISKYVDENKSVLFRLHVSKSDTLTQAGEIEKKLENMGFQEAFIVRI